MGKYRTRTEQQYRECVKRFVRRTREKLDRCSYYPRAGIYKDSVLLAMFSKSIRVSESICCLVDGGYGEEAFGTTRTLLDLLFNMRYIVNKETEERAKRYYNLFSKTTLHWIYVANEFYAPATINLQPIDPRIANLANSYKGPHHWAGPGMTAKSIAMEPDTQEVDASGNGITFKFQYEVLFRWTSHFIHPTITALHNHLVQPGAERFRVHARKEGDINFGDSALHNVVAFLGQITTQFFRGMGDDYSGHLGTYGLKLLEALTRR